MAKVKKKVIKNVSPGSKKGVGFTSSESNLLSSDAKPKTIRRPSISKRLTEIKESAAEKLAVGCVKTLSKKPKPIKEGISWGCPSINVICTGNPYIGIVPGRIYEVFGQEGSSKTTLCLTAIAECQAAGGIAAFIDAEHSFDPAYASRIGVRLEELLFTQPDCGEEGLEVAEFYIRQGVNLIIVDSVAALTPRAEIEGEMGDSHMGLHARLMSQAMRKITAATSKSKSAIVFINQLRYKISIAGPIYGDPFETTGGKALKFYTSIRLSVYFSVAKDKKLLDDNSVEIGGTVTIRAVKNKLFTPKFKTLVRLYYGLGLDRVGDLYSLALKYGLVRRSNKSGVFNITTRDGKELRTDKLSEYAPDIEYALKSHYEAELKKVDD